MAVWVEGGPVMGLPRGTVTFVFTDLEGSTRRWKAHPEQMAGALARHDAIVRDAVVPRYCSHRMSAIGSG